LCKRQNRSNSVFDSQKPLVVLLGFTPCNLQYYRLALLHKSALVTDGNGQKLDNERLEFLGDALLQAIISDVLYKSFPLQDEGFLSMMRSKVVKREHVDELAEKIGLPSLVQGRANNNSHMYGNALEALIGAIYLDQGFDKCKQFVENQLLLRYVNLERLAKIDEDFKSKLIGWGQKQNKIVRFELIAQERQDGNRTKFHSKVYIDDTEMGLGVGFTKRQAEQNASKQALRKI